MNSLLQQMYMNTYLREAVLKTKLHISQRSTLWHYTDAELVGRQFYFEYSNGAYRLGNICEFDSSTKYHKVAYIQSPQDITPSEEVWFKIREGRFGKETGRVRSADSLEQNVDTEREEAACKVLEQLQRTFIFLKFSKRRFFDPRPFVDACKVLNMSFNVYHQNDAAEFYDQLLDRLETAMKGKATGQNLWSEVMLKSVFGGRTLYQKIPRECSTYLSEKEKCGQVKGAREEPFLKIELMIRGHEQIDESLAVLVQGELMDGENKVMCDVCMEKKAVVLRTCINNLPNLLVLHLKRFDLDFTTFETVKLNTRMSFEQTLNMLKYTKEGIDYEERLIEKKKQRLASNDEEEESTDRMQLQYEVDAAIIDPSDYEYELGGILVHAGIAQGGHYYSFIKDTDASDRWYRFEDDEVSLFNPQQIAYQCFGGHFSNGSSAHPIEEERTSNALMLFYRKIRPTVSEAQIIDKKIDLVDGYEAFLGEVKDSNERHVMLSYLLDVELQPLVRDLLVLSIKAFEDNALVSDRVLEIVSLGCRFLLDVVLHFRERAGMQQWIHVLHDAFVALPPAAHWFIRQLTHKSGWLIEFLHCPDPLARVTFGELMCAAIAVAAPTRFDALVRFIRLGPYELEQVASRGQDEACALVTFVIVRALYEPPNRMRSADEILIIIRELASIPSVCVAILELGVLEDLVYFVLPDRVPDSIKAKFRGSSNPRIDPTTYITIQNVFEALAALLGVPQRRKIDLIDENCSYWDPEFIDDAKIALQQIFDDIAQNNLLDGRTFMTYYEKLHGSNIRNLALLVRNIFDKYETVDGKLTFSGFCKYHAELAISNPKAVWRV